MTYLLLDAPASTSDTTQNLDLDLDVTFLESGTEIDKLIRMTDDGCNSTCATACVSCR